MASLRKLRQFINSSATKASRPLSVLGDIARANSTGNDELAAFSTLLKTASAFTELTSFLTSDDRSWSSSPDPADFPELVFVSSAHEAFLTVAKERLSNPDHGEEKHDKLARSLLKGVNSSESIDIDFGALTIQDAAAPVFRAYTEALRKGLEELGVPTSLQDQMTKQITEAAGLRLLNQVSAAKGKLQAVFNRFVLGGITAVRNTLEATDKNKLSSAEGRGKSQELPLPDLQVGSSPEKIDFEVRPKASGDLAQREHARKILIAVDPTYERFLIQVEAAAAQEHDEVGSKFEFTRKLMKAGNFKGAADAWRVLIDEIKGSTSWNRNDYGARSMANLGLCQFYLGDRGTAEQLFNEAFSSAPHRPSIQFFGAFGHILRGQHPLAKALLTPLLSGHPDLPDTIILYADCIAHESDDKAAVDFLLAHKSDRENWYLTMCHHLNGSGLHAEAEKIARDGLAKHPHSEGLNHALAYSTITPYMDRKIAEHDFIYARNAEEHARFTSAATLIRESIEIAFREMRLHVLPDYYGNLSAIYASIFNDKSALDLVKEAQARSIVSQRLLENATLSALRLKDWHTVDALIAESRLNSDPITHARRQLITAVASRDASYLETALADSEQLLETSYEVSVLRIEALISHSQLKRARAELDKHSLRYGKTDEYYILSAEYFIRERNFSSAAEDAKKALESTTQKWRARDIAGYAAYRCGQWQAALGYFTRPGLEIRYSPRALETLHCLLQLGQTEECLASMPGVRAENPEESARLNEIEAAALIKLRRLPDALKKLAELCETASKPYFWLKRHELLARLNRIDEARRVVEEASKRYRGNADVLAARSAQYLLDGDPRQSYAAAKTALSLEPESREAQRAIGRLSIVLEKFNTAERQEIIQFAISSGILIPVTLPEKRGRPDGRSLLGKDSQRNRSARRKPANLWGWYRAVGQPMTLGSLRLAKSIPSLWQATVDSETYVVHAAPRDNAECEKLRTNATAALKGSVVIDPIAILTCDLLGIWSEIPKLFQKIYVSERAVDAFVENAQSMRLTSDGPLGEYHSVLLHGETPPTTESRARLIERLGRICEILHMPPFEWCSPDSKAIQRVRQKRRLKSFPLPLIEPGLLGRQFGVPVWTDDVLVAKLATVLHLRPTMPTWAVLYAAGMAELLPGNVVVAKTFELASSNYRFTPVFRDAFIDEFRSWRGGPTRARRSLVASITNTNFGRFESVALLGGMIGTAMLNDSDHAEDWRAFAAQFLRNWQLQSSTFDHFCAGAAGICAATPDIYFGLVRRCVADLPPDRSPLFLASAIRVCRVMLKGRIFTNPMSWEAGLSRLLLLRPRPGSLI